MGFLRNFERFGQLVQLVSDCFKEFFAFLVFYISILLVFSLIYQIFGVDMDADAYDNLDLFFVYTVQLIRNSIGDLDTPSYPYWSHRKNSANDNDINLMIYSIWGFWLTQILVFTIILLNFLIAVVS